MRALIALIVIIYLVGVGVALSPTIQAKWNGASASELRHKRRAGSPQCSRVAGEGLPQHNRPWLIAFDRPADVGCYRKDFGPVAAR